VPWGRDVAKDLKGAGAVAVEVRPGHQDNHDSLSRVAVSRVVLGDITADNTGELAPLEVPAGAVCPVLTDQQPSH
jgi:hypothetical protein